MPSSASNSSTNSRPTSSGEPEQPLALSATGLGKRFGRHWALSHLDFELSAGDSLLLVGANGSGKTTLLRLICGLLRPTKGNLRVFDYEPAENPFEVRPRLTLVSHRGFLYEQLTANEHLDLWTGLAKKGPRPGLSTASRVDLLDSVALQGRGDEPVANYSAGMRKRLTLLRTKIEDPDLVLLDEPFSALDPAGQTMIASWLAELQQAGKTLVVASHALERARPLCRRALVLRNGQIVWRGPAADVEPGLLHSDLAPKTASLDREPPPASSVIDE